MELREEIEQFLKERKLSQSDLARSLGVKPSLINRIVNGKQDDMMASTYRKLREILDAPHFQG